MAGAVRVNLSITERIDKALTGYAEMTGRTKTAVIMEAVGYQLSHWEKAVRSYRAELRYHGGLEDHPSVGTVKAAKVAGAAVERDASRLSPQEEWNLELERKNAAKAKADRG